MRYCRCVLRGVLDTAHRNHTTQKLTAKHSGTLALLLPMSLDWFIGPFLGSDRQVVAGYTGYTTSDCRQLTWAIHNRRRLRPRAFFGHFQLHIDFYYNKFLFHLHHFIFGFARVGFGADAA